MPARQPKRLDERALFEYAVRTLASRARSSGELREKLRRKAEDPAAIDPVMARLKEYGYLNDRKFAEAVAGARVQNQGFGKARVLRELRSRRVAPKVAEEAIAGAYEGVDENAMIADFLARKFRRVDLRAELADPRKLASAYRKLRVAGFSGSNSIRALKRYSEEADQLEDTPGQD